MVCLNGVACDVDWKKSSNFTFGVEAMVGAVCVLSEVFQGVLRVSGEG